MIQYRIVYHIKKSTLTITTSEKHFLSTMNGSILKLKSNIMMDKRLVVHYNHFIV